MFLLKCTVMVTICHRYRYHFTRFFYNMQAYILGKSRVPILQLTSNTSIKADSKHVTTEFVIYACLKDLIMAVEHEMLLFRLNKMSPTDITWKAK